jgi:hypothetical protein
MSDTNFTGAFYIFSNHPSDAMPLLYRLSLGELDIHAKLFTLIFAISVAINGIANGHLHQDSPVVCPH